jgi:hypothetical protein
LPSETATHSDVTSMSGLNHIIQGMHLEIYSSQTSQTRWGVALILTVSSIGVSGSNLWDRINEQGKGERYSLPVTLEYIHIVDLEACQAGLDGVEDVLMPRPRVGSPN